MKRFLRFLHFTNPFIPVRIVAALSALLIGAGFCIGPNAWHSIPPFHFINIVNNYLNLSWILYGIWLLVAGISLLIKETRPLGYLLGGMIYTFFACCTWLAAGSGLFAPCNLTTVAVFYWSALKVSIYDQIDPDRKLGRL